MKTPPERQQTEPDSVSEFLRHFQPLASRGEASGVRALLLVAMFLLAWFIRPGTATATGFLQVRNGYFWDAERNEYFIPRGFGYQTFNPPVGANQTPEQLDYDLHEFKKMYVNSLRVDLPWPQIETAWRTNDWRGPDYLISKAEELGLRLFILIGFQYAADWFPTNGYWRAINEQGSNYFIMNYENPEVRLAYSNYIYQVTARYKDSPAVGAWILGNEYSYFDLWNPTNKLYFGYDPISKTNFQKYLARIYTNNIAGLNTNWGTNFTSFDQVVMPPTYPADRTNSAYYDLIQWRKHGIGDLVAVGAMAARKADTNHLLSYSMIGGIFSGDDNKYTCEDEKVIVAHCAAVGAPLDFWSVNNYAYTAEGGEMRSADFGIAKYHESGLPVLVTETGHSSTDDVFPEEQVRYAKALPSQLWEALLSGAMGVHVFTWNDRHVFGPSYFPRERGFGIVHQDRIPKEPVYTNVLETFRRMENLNVPLLLGGTTNPATDVQFFWSTNADMVWPRANQETAMLWGTLRRLGYQPGIINDEKFASGAATNAAALILARCWLMDPRHLDTILSNLIPAGVHLHANADLPGQLDKYQKPNPGWAAKMSYFFGLNVAGASPGYDQGVRATDYYGRVNLTGVGQLGDLQPGYSDHLGTWKVWHGILPASELTIIRHTGNNGSQSLMPALQVKDLVTAKTAINTFALGDTYSGEKPTVTPPQHQWEIRSTWMRSIYSNYFGIRPSISLSGQGSTYALPDYRLCPNGSLLLGLLNESTNPASLKVSSPTLLNGKTVENLTLGGVLETNSDGEVSVAMGGDEYVLLYAYDSGSPSLVDGSRNKLWIQSAPLALWPNGTNCTVQIGLDVPEPDVALALSLERVLAPNIIYALTNFGPVSGKTSVNVSLRVPDADPNDPWYVSSFSGGDYVLHAWFTKNDVPLPGADSYLPVRLLWGVYPVSLPASVVPGSVCQITVGWQELPSYLSELEGLPLSYAPAWQPYLASQQYYKIRVELISAGTVVATQEFLTNEGTGQHTLSVTVPAGTHAPFLWNAYLVPAPYASVDMCDSFEFREPGNGYWLLEPWHVDSYAEVPDQRPVLWDSGVGTNATTDGVQEAFLIYTNLPTRGNWSGAFMSYGFPSPFALPREPSLWTNYAYSFDFFEKRDMPCILEMQLKDGRNGQLHFTTNYTPGVGWNHVQASLDNFTVPTYDPFGFFDPENVTGLVVNVQMLQAGAMYQLFFDNIQFIGPKKTEATAAPADFWDDFDNRPSGEGDSILAPWGTYPYSEHNNTTLEAKGIAKAQGTKGGQAAFVVAKNPPNPGNYAGFGMYYLFASPWALPADETQWTNYVFSYDFRETNGRKCTLEMQVKSGQNEWIEFTKPYEPGANGWDRIRASVASFAQPPGIGNFNPDAVYAIVANIRIHDTGVTYTGYIDNVWFDAPDMLLPDGWPTGVYLSGNDSGPQDEAFSIQEVRREPSGVVYLSWFAKANRIYTVEHQDGSLEGSFEPLAPPTNYTVAVDRLLEVSDTNAPSAETRFYRVRAQKR